MKRKINALSLSLFLLSSLSLVGQAIDFERFYGNESTDDHFNDMIALPGGGYLAVGESQAEDKLGEIYLVQFDAAGNVVMEKEYGTPGIETAHAVARLADRYVIGGSTYTDGENNLDGYLITVDFAGNLIDEASFGGAGDDIVYALTALENGDVAVGAAYEDVVETGTDFQVRRYSTNLELIAQHTYVAPIVEHPQFIIEDPGTGNILAGGRSNSGGLLLHLSADLESVLWEKIVYGSSSLSAGIVYDQDHYAIGVRRFSASESYVGLVNKNTGEITNKLFLPNLGSHTYLIQEMIKEADQLYILAEYFTKFFFQYDLTEETVSEAFELPIFTSGLAVGAGEGFAIAFQPLSDDHKIAALRQYDAELQTVWESTSGDDAEFSTQEGMQVVEAAAGGFLLGGEVRPGNWRAASVMIQKIDADGELLWQSELGTGYNNGYAGMVATPDGGCLVGVTSGVNGLTFNKLAFYKLNEDGTSAWVKEVDSPVNINLRNGSLVMDANGDFYFSGNLSNSLLVGTYLLKMNESGDIIWESGINSAENEFMFFNKMIVAANQDLLMVGDRQTFDGYFPILHRVNPAGEVLWSAEVESVGAPGGFKGLVEDAQGHILALSEIGKVAEFDAAGNLLDAAVMEIEPGNNSSNAQDICMGTDQNFYILDRSNKFTADTIQTLFNLFRARYTRVHVFDSEKNFLATRAFGVGQGTTAERLLAHSEDGVAFFGTGRDGNIDKGQLVWFNAADITTTINVRSQGHLKVYPTVSERYFNIELNSPHRGLLNVQIYNASGQLLQNTQAQKWDEAWQQQMDISKLPNGSYYIHLSLRGYGWTKRLVKA